MIHNDKVDPRIILFHTHNPTNKNNLFLPQLFPNSKKLFITRDPEQSLERWIDIFYPQSSKKTNKIFAYRTIATIFHEFFSKIFHPSLYDNSCYILHLEDLKRAPHQVLKKFCTLFDLTWDPILLSTTVYGIEYHGIQNTQAISAADSSHLTSYAGKVFSERDRQRLNPLFNYMRKQYGYSYSEETIDKTLVQTSRELFDFEIKFCEMVEFPAEKLRETTIFHSVHKHYENMIHMVRDKSRALDNRRSFIRISG
jgi:hypothetical protein